MRKQKGFTLIELLVACAIIGILATIMIVNFNGAQAKARDARRIADMDTIAKTIRIYYENQGSVFPVNLIPTKYCLFPFSSKPGAVQAFDTDPTSRWESGCLEGVGAVGGLITKNMLSKMPADPKPSATSATRDYAYYSDPTNSFAVVGAVLEVDVKKSYIDNTQISDCSDAYCIKIIP